MLLVELLTRRVTQRRDMHKLVGMGVGAAFKLKFLKTRDLNQSSSMEKMLAWLLAPALTQPV